MSRLLVPVACIAVFVASCSSEPKSAPEVSASLQAARTCGHYLNLITPENREKRTPSQARALIFNMAADLKTDAERDNDIAVLANAFNAMTDAIKAGDSISESAFAQTVVKECTPLLKAHHLLKP